MGMLDAIKNDFQKYFLDKAHNPQIAGFHNDPLLQYSPKKSAAVGKSTRHYNQLADILRPTYKQALIENPNINKDALAQSLVRAYSDNIESNFSDEERNAFLQYRQKHNIDAYSFKRLWDSAPKHKDTFLPFESFGYNANKWLNLIGTDNLQEIQQTEINRLKQKRGQGLLTLETASDMVFDPLGVFVPAGLVSKASGGWNLTKSMLGGGLLGAGVGAQELNRDDTSFSDNLQNIALGALTGGMLNLGISAALNKKYTGSFGGGMLNHPNAMNPQDAFRGIEISENMGENLPNVQQTQQVAQGQVAQGVEGQPSNTATTQPQVESQTATGIRNFLDEKMYPTAYQNKGIEISENMGENLPQSAIPQGQNKALDNQAGFSKETEAKAKAIIDKVYANLQAQIAKRMQGQNAYPNSILEGVRKHLKSNVAQENEAVIPQKLKINQKTLSIPQEVQDIYRVLQGGETTQEDFLRLYKYPLDKFLERLRKSLNSATTTSGDYGKGKEIYDLLRDSKQLEAYLDKALKIPQEYIPSDESMLAHLIGANPSDPKELTYAYSHLPTLKAKGFTDANANANILKELRKTLERKTNLHPHAEFGTNYAEFYRDGKGGIAKILNEAKDYEARKVAGELTESEIKQGGYKGQVAGAFYRKDLQELSGNGNIDLVWGEVQGKGKDAKGYGLAKILEKHLEDFKDFAGDSIESKLINGLSEIVERGKIIQDKNGRLTIQLDNFKIGLKQNWKGEPTQNKWIITAYEDTRGGKAEIINSDFLTKGETLPLNSNKIIPQSPKQITLQDIEKLNESFLKDLKEYFKEKVETGAMKKATASQYYKKSEQMLKDLSRMNQLFDTQYLNSKDFETKMRGDYQRILDNIKLGLIKNKNADVRDLRDKLEKYDNLKLHSNADTFYKLESQKGKGILDRIRELRITKEKKEQEILGRIRGVMESSPNAYYKIEEQEKGILDKVREYLPKQKTINAVDNFAKSADFKALSKDKQSAILSLKSIKPSPMPKEIPSAEFENLLKHFNSKTDKKQRERYLALFADTKVNSDVTLVLDGGRREYIKAYQHKENKDLYYLAITENGDKVNITGIPTTQVKKVINEIQRSQKVEFARASQEVTNLANLANKGLNPAVSNKIIPQSNTNAQNPLAILDKHAPNLADAARLENLSSDLKELQTRFKLRNKDKENAKLFDKVLIVAQQLGVKVNLNATSTKKGALGSFNTKTNTIELFTKNAEKQAETILHELIHAVTIKALKTDEKLLTPLQKEAIKEIHTAYNALIKEARLKGEYGITNVEEMLAELSNKTFRDKLDNKGILRRILDAITNLVFKNKTNPSVSYADLKNSLVKLIDNYNLEGGSIGDSTHYKLSKEAKEQKGIYNVTYNGKNATLIKRDLESVENAIALRKGYHNNARDTGRGANHIKVHLEQGAEGFITDKEMLNLGKDLRAYLDKYKEPFIDSRGARIYEWFNESGVKFRLVVDDLKAHGAQLRTAQPLNDEIITYFSNRNSDKMKSFKNPQVQQAYNAVAKNAPTQDKDTFYKLESEFKDKGVFRKLIDTAVDKALDNHLIYEGLNKLGVHTYREKDYMALREAILNNNNGSVKAMVDLNNLLNAKFNKEELREMQRYYVGDNYDSKIVTDELKGVADTIKEKINALTQTGIQKGIFPEYYKEMKDYLKRGYEKHLFNHKGHLKSSALEFHKIQHRGTSKYVSEAQILRMRENGEMAVTLQDYKKGKWIISENKDSKGRREIYRDWSKKERESMGEIEDFSFNVARTIDTIQKQLYTHDFLKDLEAKAILVKANGKTPVGYVDSSAEFGIIGNPFKSYYIKAEVAQDLKETFYKMYGEKSEGLKLLKNAVSIWKGFKTIWNPVSHNNNILGSAVFMIASGEYKAAGYLMSNISKSILGNQVFGKYKKYKEAKLNNKYLSAESVLRLKPEEIKDMQLLEELERRGYFDKSFLNNIVENYHAKHNGIQKGKENLLKRFHNKLGNMYNGEDVLARFSLAKSFLEQGMEMHQALELTSKVLPDYSKPMPYWLKNADRLGILPFIQFTYHATPIIAKQVLGFSHKGGWSRKQATINIAALMAYGLYHTMAQPLPDGYFGSEVQIGRSGDNVRTLRIGSIVPHLQALEFLPGSSSGIGNYAPEFLRKSAMGNPYMQMLGLAANENYNFGSKITRRSGGLGALDRFGALVDFTTPAPVGKLTNLLINARELENKRQRDLLKKKE